MGFFNQSGGGGLSEVHASDVIGLATVAISGNYYDLAATPTSMGVSDYNDLINKPTIISSIVEDTTPELGGELDCGNHSIGFNEYDNGNSGTADTIDWRLSNKQKSTLTGNPSYTFIPPSKPTSLTLKCVQDGSGSRILDEICVTSTNFAANAVDTNNETINIGTALPTGTRIRFSNSGGSLPTGLVAGTIYYAIYSDSSKIKVASSYANASAGTAINLSAQGSGTHTVQSLVKWSGGSLPILSTTSYSVDVLSFYYDGVHFNGVMTPSFS